ncbi:hypothetical protein QQG91_08650 [Marivivens sp. LCG002]|uniref:hypothetical protein n=1 Tax=Marivivens sp. LCG002 TaxID=3051171 RepID=UPI00255689AF|nr:hypothetical protein [Marivivens sp. LCG002]WIV49745.1 hypothetical protein QQG91_08650 [Marivivens sp. LCG002]
MPIYIYLDLDISQLNTLSIIDFNSYIRADFIRGAMFTLKDNLLTGVGFGPAYRPINFSYLSDHPLLNQVSEMQRVSNHHSIFDVAYRLGIPATIPLIYEIFIAPRLSGNDSSLKFLMISLALGLSVNAWFENQAQLPLMALISATIISSRNRQSKTLI